VLLVLGLVAGAALGPTRAGRGSLLALGVAATGLLGLGLGLRISDARAQLATQDAAPVVAALELDLAAGRRYRSLDQVPPATRTLLPPPPHGFGPWYYVPIRGGFLLGFRGPLAWHYEYHSRRGSWNLPRYTP